MQDQRRIGRTEGQQERAIESAKRILRRYKLTITEIAEDTGLDISTVEKLAAEM